MTCLFTPNKAFTIKTMIFKYAQLLQYCIKMCLEAKEEVYSAAKCKAFLH